MVFEERQTGEILFIFLYAPQHHLTKSTTRISANLWNLYFATLVHTRTLGSGHENSRPHMRTTVAENTCMYMGLVMLAFDMLLSRITTPR